MIGFSGSAISVLDKDEFSISEVEDSSLIHMDVDQSFLPLPSPVKAAIFESFARQNMAESEVDVTTSIRRFIKNSYGYPTDSSAEFIYADSSLALFNKLVLCCIQEGGTLCYPAGTNGNYVSAAKFLKANVLSIATHVEEGFKLTEKTLTRVLEAVNKPWVYISGPTINPTGLIYSDEEIGHILSVCAKFGARVVIDTSFSGSEFNLGSCTGWNLEDSIAKLSSSGPSFCVSLLGGLSLKMRTGGLTFGFLVLNQPPLIDSFHSFPGLSKPHTTVNYTMKKLLSLTEQNDGALMDAIAEQKRILGSRSKRLKETLESCGWDVLESYAGVSMVARPLLYIGKKARFEHSSCNGGSNIKLAQVYAAMLDYSNIREALHKATGLCINTDSWTGLPGYCRFTIALEDKEFEQALDCIVKFKNLIM